MYKKFVPITGSGGGKSGSSAGPVEAPNTLQSKATAKIVDVLCEGPIKGLVDGEKSIILQKVAVQNPDGSRNVKGFSYAMLPGYADQPSLPGYDGVQNEVDVSRRVRADTPVVYATQSDSLDAIIVTVTLPALSQQDKKKGNLNGYSVTFSLEARNMSNVANNYVMVFDHYTISGKNTSPYEESFRISLNGEGPWLIRMTRNSPDNDNDVTINDKTFFGHVTEVIEHKIAYADTAVVGTEFSAEDYGSSVPPREFDGYWALIEYPSNYDPIARTYSGFWNGTWSFGWCNNPAWVFRDLAKSSRFGADIDPAYLDKWYLFELSKYCDDLVPDGYGGLEPRFVFNGGFSTQDEAYKVLQSIASMMRAIVFYAAGAVIVRQDKPRSAEHNIYTKANIIGDFQYAGTALKVRRTAALVQWINPALGYDVDYELYENKAAILKYGFKQLPITAIGTTSRGQAHRQGKWAILTEQYNTDTISFQAGLDSSSVLPGDLIEVADPHFATADFAGRVKQPSGVNVCTVSSSAGWGVVNMTASALRMPGPNGSANLALVTSDTSFGQHYAYINQSNLTAGQTYTYSVFVAKGTTPFAMITAGSFTASFDIMRGKVRRKTTGLAAKIDDWMDGTVRLSITFVAPATTMLLTVGPDAGQSAVRVSGAPVAWSGAGEQIYHGSAQVELGSAATIPYPRIAFPANQLMLDRDIEYIGALQPQLHVTLLDGVYDDIPGLDNSERPVRRKVTYFTSNITSYEPETNIITLSNPIPAGGNDNFTPFIWIFSKTQLVPSKWSVIDNKENDDHNYEISALNYSAQKFIDLDENFYITEPDGNISNLPRTSFCFPPSDLHAVYTTTLKGAVLSANVNLGWTASIDQFLKGYVVAYRRDLDNWVTLPLTTETNLDLTDLPIGGYQFAVRAFNKFGIGSVEISTALDISATVASGKNLITGVVTDRGDTTFTDRDIKLFWTSRSLSQHPQTPSIYGVVYRGSGLFTLESGAYLLDESNNAALSMEIAPDATIAVDLTNPANPVITVGGSFVKDDDIEFALGLSTFAYNVGDDNSINTIAEALRQAIDDDPRFTAVRSGGIITMGFSIAGTNASDMEAHNDPLFKQYNIVVRNPVTQAVLRTSVTKTPEYQYPYSVNLLDTANNPRRNLRFDISVQDVYDNVSTPYLATIFNPPPELAPVNASATAGFLNITFTQPSDPDFRGIMVWASQSNGFVPSPANLVFQDRSSPTIPLLPNTTYFYRYAFYDLFGVSDVFVSPQYTIDIPGITASDFDTTPPGIPTFNANPLSSSIITDPVTHLQSTALTFTWNPNNELDLAGYDTEFREGATGNWIGGYRTAPDRNSYRIGYGIKANTIYYARVRAFDKTNNTSGFSLVAGPYTTLKDNIPPAVATTLSAVASFGSIFVSWTNPADTDLDTVEVWVNSVNDSSTATRLTVVNGRANVPGTYTLSSLPVGTTKWFWLKTVDNSNNQSAFSAAVSATTGQIGSGDLSSSIRAIEAFNAFPTTGNYVGRIVLLTTDNKLYTYDGTTPWASSAGGGMITSTQITDGAITTPKLATNSVTSDKIVANSIIAGLIAANAITAVNIVAGTITGDRLFAGTITGDKISTSTSLPGTITIGATGVTISTTQAQAANSSNVTLYTPIWNDSRDDQYAIRGNLVTKVQPSAWTSNIYGREVQTGSAFVSGSFSSAGGTFIALTDNVTYTNVNDYLYFKYAIHLSTDAGFGIGLFEGGSNPISFGMSYGGVNFGPSTIFKIVYDGVIIKYYADNVLLRSVAAGANRTFRVGINVCNAGSFVNNIAFGSAPDNSLSGADPAARVNIGTTTIDPGKILISGGTTLANWRNGSDNTRIEGGSIAANTISANKVSIGMRGILVESIDFQAQPNGIPNYVSWGPGRITFTDDAGNVQVYLIPGGGVGYSNAGQPSTTLYLIWYRLHPYVDYTYDPSYAASPDWVVLATYLGGTNLNPNLGRTIIDGDKITTGTITAAQIKVGSIIADRLAAYSITALQIAANSISADRLSVSSLSAVSANLGVVTAGILYSPGGLTQLDLNNNRIIFDNGVVMLVQGTGFGSSNQFVRWFGPHFASLASCTQTNAIEFLTVTGDAYFGGSLSAGKLRNSAQSSVLTTSATVYVGPFTTNGGPKSVVFSYSFNWIHASPGGGSDVTSAIHCNLQIQRSYDGANWTVISPLNVTGTYHMIVDGEPGVPNQNIYNASGSTSFVDNTGAGVTMYYRGIIVSRDYGNGTSNCTQTLSIVSTE